MTCVHAGAAPPSRRARRRACDRRRADAPAPAPLPPLRPSTPPLRPWTRAAWCRRAPRRARRAPDRRGVGAEPAADLDVVVLEDPRLDLLAVDALGDAHGGELRELVIGLGEQLEAAAADLLLEVSAGVGVTLEAVLEALVEDAAERLVQRVDVEDRRGVVVRDRPLDPVLAQQVEVERERDRRLARGDALERAVGDRDRRHAGRRGERLLGARVGVVEAPLVELDRVCAEGGDAVDEEQRVAAAALELAPELLDRVAYTGRRS